EAAVSDLLDLANLESGKLRLRLVDGDLAAAAISAVELTRPLAEEKGQELAVVVPHTPCPARFDPARLAQVLLHLLNNAVKYTPEGGSIKVEVRPCMGEYSVDVRDTGCGVTPAAQETIFERFFIPDGDSGVIGLGGGLGLPLARALVNLHDGCLRVASTGIPGEGSIFYFNLPYTPSRNYYLPNVNLCLPALSPSTFILVSEQEKTRGQSPPPDKATNAIRDHLVRILHKEEQEMTRYFSDKRYIGLVWGVIRVWLGYSFINAGWQKLTDAQGLWIGSKAGTVVTGFLQGAIKNSTGAHASVHPWYASLAQNFFIPNAGLFSYLVAFGETLVGTALIVGIFTRFAAAMGLTLNLAFMFAGSTGTNVEMVVAEVAIVSAGFYASYYGLDRFVLPYLKKMLHIGANTTTMTEPTPTFNPQPVAHGIR
ncbi:MAG: hypothetical protein DLM69_06340, partial [Candidatus Chloroheliales bacterium]